MYMRESEVKMSEERICPVCGDNPIEDEETQCETCREDIEDQIRGLLK